MTTRAFFEEYIGRSPTSEDGASEQEVAATEKRIGAKLPSELRDFYLTAERNAALMKGYQHFVPLVKLSITDDRLVFLVENQEACSWGVRLDNGSTVEWLESGSTWEPEGSSLEAFLTMTKLYQLAWGGFEHIAYHHEPDQVITKLQAQMAVVHERDGESVLWTPHLFVSRGAGDFLLAAGRTADDLASVLNEFGFEE